MKRIDIGIGILLILIGVYLVSKVGEYTYMTEFSPGPGFMPFWLGWVLIILAGVLILWNLVKSPKAKALKGGMIREVVLLVCGLGVSIPLIEWLGFIVTVTLVALTMMMLLNRRSWLVNVAVAVCTALVLRFVFQGFLEVTLPKGILGF